MYYFGFSTPGSLRATARYERVCPKQTILVAIWIIEFEVLASMKRTVRILIAAKQRKVGMNMQSESRKSYSLDQEI